MNPAFSVIVFTTLSGTGFGLWFWLALRIALGDNAQWFDGIGWALGLITGGVLVAAGVIASLWHLGKPMRVWRALSQWRSSWMSREGVFAIASMAVAAATVLVQSTVIDLPQEPLVMRLLCALLAPLSLAAIVSTAMIYGSLKTIPAWRHRLVVPAYLLFALLGGGLLFGPFAATTMDMPRLVGIGVLVGAVVLALVKWRYWRDLDRDALPLDRGDAVGLPGRDVSVFERPHTEANYLNREMGFVVARKHARKLRTIALLLFALVPALCAVPMLLLPHGGPGAFYWVAALSFQIGALVERWLFFAEAKHVVTLYY
ncbi:dimethyl sulfoxide reductase anchor subunit family protein [Lysobacter brunescens]|uniref:Dimethyl sulfoxide reductase anchor subunit family protein n=1 Tax=Lysobacter brunescens TaxID=262323 RepID=A0ABW2Y9D6_9GAMM